MAEKGIELLTVRGYAVHRAATGLPGKSHTAVQKAIQTGRLSSAAAWQEGGEWRINPEVADREWEANTRTLLQRPSATAAEEDSPPPAAPEVDGGGSECEADLDHSLSLDWDNLPPVAESERLKVAAEAEKKKIEVQQLRDELIPLYIVKSEAFKMGQLFRETAERIPIMLMAAVEKSWTKETGELMPEKAKAELRIEMDSSIKNLLIAASNAERLDEKSIDEKRQIEVNSRN